MIVPFNIVENLFNNQKIENDFDIVSIFKNDWLTAIFFFNFCPLLIAQYA